MRLLKKDEMVSDELVHANASARSWIFRTAEQPIIATFVLFGAVTMVVYFIQQGGLRQRVIEIDRAPKREITFQIDINEAPWPEMTLLPGVGETLARRIVADRVKNGKYFEMHDLTRVDGIGPKTLEQIQPFLLPLASTEKIDGGTSS